MHKTSSPYNPRSNGHAEAAVKAAKYLLLKTTPASALAAWRNTAKENKPSPNEIMFCRKVRDEKGIHASQLQVKLPRKIDDHIHKLNSSVEQDPSIDATQETRASDTPTKSASDNKNALSQQIPEKFQQGDRVCVQNPCTKCWDVTALITGFSKTGRTLKLLTDEGDLMLRNRRFVRKKCAA